MSGLKMIHANKENKAYRYICLAVVYLILSAMFAAYVSVFETGVNRELAYGSRAVAVFCLGIFVILFEGGKKRPGIRKMGFALSGAAAVVMVLGYRLWTPGAFVLVNDFIGKYNQFYGAGFPRMEEAGGVAIFCALFVVQFLLGAILVGILLRGRFLFVAVPVMLLPGILGAFVGYLPSVTASWVLLGACCLFMIVGHSGCGKGWTLELAGGMLVFLILYGCAAAVSPAILQLVGEHEQEYTKIRKDLLQAQKVDVGAMLAEHMKGESDYSKGGVGKGDFRNLSSHHPQGTKELEVVVTGEPKSRVYLRAYVGVDYTGNGWKEMSSIRFAEMAAPIVGEGKKKDLLNEPFRRIHEGSSGIEAESMWIKRFGASGEFGYTPYYAQIPDNLTVRLDAYVKGNGRKEWEYEYYPSRKAENVGEEDLAAKSKDWENYCTFVEENYKEYPKELERLGKYCVLFDKGSADKVASGIDYEFSDDLSYSLEPGQTPEGKDFAEYFLLDNQKGFCVHFATTAALIYRKCGYASRYVEGYAVSPERFEKQSDGTYRAVVTDEMAHAWCETFDSELGWQVREHTLPYTGTEAQPEALRNQNDEENAPGPDNTEDEDRREEENPEDTENENADPEGEDEENENEPASEEGIRENDPADEEEGGPGIVSSGKGSGMGGTNQGGTLFEKWQKFRESRAYALMMRVLSGLGCLAALIGILWISGFVWYRIRRRKRLQAFRKRKDNRGIASIYAEIYRITVFLGMKDMGFSENELGEIWKREYPYLTGEEWDWLTHCAVRSAFSGEKTGKEDWVKMYKLYQKFRGGVLAELKGRRRWVFLYMKAL
ncbi:transglutaminase domain-containing protein [Roseburia hominis]